MKSKTTKSNLKNTKAQNIQSHKVLMKLQKLLGDQFTKKPKT